MTLVEQINNDIKEAMKAKDPVRLRGVRAIKAAILLANTDGSGLEMDLDREIKLLQKLVKQRQDSLAIYEAQNRPDLAQYLQVLTGVIFSGDQGGQLYIRGGTPIQNKVLMDGMVIYNPFHSIGLYSVFDADIIRGADIYTGGFNAEYGDRISSIMDITTRDGNKKRIAGKVSANTFTAKALV